MYELSAGVPMIKAGPRMPSANEVSTGVSLVDVYPTVLDICDAPEDEESQKLPGTSLKNAASPDNAERTVLSEYYDGGSTTGTYMVRSRTWKYVNYFGHSPQLFDLRGDPNEMVNRPWTE